MDMATQTVVVAMAKGPAVAAAKRGRCQCLWWSTHARTPKSLTHIRWLSR